MCIETINSMAETIAELEQELDKYRRISVGGLSLVGCTGCVHYDQQQTAMICRDCKRYYRDMYEDGDKVTIVGKDKI